MSPRALFASPKSSFKSLAFHALVVALPICSVAAPAGAMTPAASTKAPAVSASAPTYDISLAESATPSTFTAAVGRLPVVVTSLKFSAKESGGLVTPSEGMSAAQAVSALTKHLAALGNKAPVRITGFSARGSIGSKALQQLGLKTKRFVRQLSPAEIAALRKRVTAKAESSAPSAPKSAGAKTVITQSIAPPNSTEPWAPDRGRVLTFDQTLSGAERVMKHTLRWNSQAAIDDGFDTFHGYEQDFKLINTEQSGSRPGCDNDDHWWGKRADTLIWQTTLPSATRPYFDDYDQSDSCTTLDFTVGMFQPKYLQAGVDYTITVATAAGNASYHEQPYTVMAQKVENNCPVTRPESAACMGLNVYAGDRQLLVGSGKSQTPECRNWANGFESARCIRTDPAAVGRLGGSFLQPALIDGWSDSTLQAELNHMKDLHMTQVVLQWTANTHDKSAGGGATVTYPSSLGYTRNTSTDVVGRLLNAADSAGLDVWVGLQANDDWWNWYATDSYWLSLESNKAKAIANELQSQYGSHRSLQGWYLPFEMDNVHFSTVTAENRMITFYNDVMTELRRITGLRPIATAPFYNAVNTSQVGWQDANAWAGTWSSILAQTDFDLVALQDGVGAGHATASVLPTWFNAMRVAITQSGSRAQLVSDAETFIIGPSKLQPMPVGQLVADMNAVASYVSGYWSFSYNHYQSPRSPFASFAYDSAYSSWVAGNSDGSAPSAPGSLTATKTDPQTVSLSWQPSTDSGSGVAGYNLYRDGSLVASRIGLGSTFVDRQLEGSHTYAYQVKAVDGWGNSSAMSNTASAVLAALPSSPTNYARCGATTGNGCTYTASIPADPAHPDAGGTKLTNGSHGALQYGPEWQGRNAVGTYTFTIDLGVTKTIKEINSTWFQVRADYSFLPPHVRYLTSTTGSTYSTAADIDLPAVSSAMQTKTYRSINLSKTARYVKVEVTGGDAWNLIDEVEVRGL